MNHHSHLRRGHAIPGRARSRRSGVVTIYILLMFPVIAGIAAISFDLSYLYNRKAEAQKAADAAALAGAVYGSDTAKAYASRNGYDAVANKAVVTAGPIDGGLYRVTLSRPENVFFARFFGIGVGNVGATATAQYLQDQLVPVQNYGVGYGNVNLSMFGPDAFHYNGDYISPRLLSNGQPNPDYNGKGYDFNVNVKGGLTQFQTDHGNNLEFEIFDPGTSNSDGNNSPTVGTAIDEIRPGQNGSSQTISKYTATYDNATPDDPSDDVTVTKSFGADDSSTDMKWTDSMDFDLTTFKSLNGTFTFNATTTDGSSENGFQVRAGPKHDATMSEADWTSQYGTGLAGGPAVTVAARGNIPMNFNTDATITIDLGHVPALADGGSITVNKFDLDVGSKSLTYIETPDGGGTGITQSGFLYSPSSLNNDVFSDDTITLPKGYAGGTWKAVYTAGWQDTSVWHVSYTGIGNLRLVR